jgi:vitamin B12 transporter
MKLAPLARLAALAALGAQAQGMNATLAFQSLDSMVVTAARSPQLQSQALRDVVVIAREEIADAGPISLAELLQRFALVEFRGTGGAGQPAGLFIRGTNTAQTLVLVDGLRVGSATVGTTSIENIPLDMIERVEIVKGPLSSLYGSDAIGGVVQVFTRASAKPRLFASAAFGNESESRASAGFSAKEGDSTLSFSAGGRKVNAASATNDRAYCHDPDRDRYESAFATAQLEQRLWQRETVTVAAFLSRGRARFDGCPNAQGQFADDRNTQTISGARLTSFSFFAPWWSSRFTLGQGRDKLATEGFEATRFETRQDQLSWVNEFGTLLGPVMAGFETVRQKVESSTAFSTTRRDTHSGFVSVNETWKGQRLEASVRRDQDDQFGGRNTGTVSLGGPWPDVGFLSATYGRGFRAPSFFDLYAPRSDDFVGNPDLRPERSRSVEYALKAGPGAAWPWRLTWFDNRIEDLIVYVFPTMENVSRARIRGLEASVEGTLMGTRLRAALTSQRPRDEDTGFRLQGRAERLGTFDASRTWGAWTVGGSLVASGPRFDSANESPESRLPGYTLLNARVKYIPERRWAVEFTATNLADKRYEHAVGYNAPGRSLLLNVRFEGF